MLFNRVLSRRVELGNWNHLLDGDIACLDGSRSNFPCQMPDPELERRCAEFDIHPSGPLPGRGAGGVEGEAANIESQVIDPYNAVIEGLGKAGLKASRRSLRVLPAKMEWEIGSKDLVLKFDLPPGAYATSVIRELVTTVRVSISEAR
jgi:tRNA pseudouridine13 synthase